MPWRNSSSQNNRAVSLRHRRVGEGFLGREGVAREPVEELQSLGADDAGLHVMDMGVDETGRDQAAGIVGKVRVGWKLRLQRGIGSDGLDRTVATNNEAVRLMHERPRRIGQERVVTAEDQRPAHGADGTGCGGNVHCVSLVEYERRAHRGFGRHDD